jgi:hypothetical protein
MLLCLEEFDSLGKREGLRATPYVAYIMWILGASYIKVGKLICTLKGLKVES